MIKVSIIIPVYNVEKYIERCLRSVISQTYSNIECILVNDGTPDRSFEIAKEFINKYNHKEKSNIDFILIEHEHNKGLSEARNTGVRASTGEYVYFLDSDDAIMPEAIKDLVQTVERNKRPDVIYGSTLLIDSKEQKGQLDPILNMISYTRNKDILLGYLNNKWSHIACNKLVNSSLFKNQNIWFYPGIYHEDELWTFEMSTVINSMIPCLKSTYIYYIGDPNSIQRRPPCEKDFIDNIKILEQKYLYINKVSCPKELAENIFNLCYLTYLSLVVLRFPRSFRLICKKKLKKIINNVSKLVDYKLTTKWYARIIWIIAR